MKYTEIQTKFTVEEKLNPCKLKINDWKYLLSYSPKLKVFIDDKEVIHKLGKHFMFVLVNPDIALKILINRGKGKRKATWLKIILKKIIKIQQIFYKENLGFDCSDTPIKLCICDLSGVKHIYYGYITSTDIDINADQNKFNSKEFKKYKLIIENIAIEIENICLKYGINRKHIHKELRYIRNYVVMKSGNLMFVDIDIKFFFTAEHN